MEIELGKYAIGFYISLNCEVCRVDKMVDSSSKIARIKAIRSLKPFTLKESHNFVMKNFANGGVGEKLCGHKTREKKWKLFYSIY